MTPSSSFRINTPHVIRESFEDEVVLVNLESGNYYSIEKVGTDVWNLIEHDTSLHEIITTITHNYQGTHEEIESGVRQFLAELQEQGLIVPVDSKEAGSEGQQTLEEETKEDAERPKFETPTLNRYTDMQDLLLLDPIHEVDESGWPTIKPDSSPEKE